MSVNNTYQQVKQVFDTLDIDSSVMVECSLDSIPVFRKYLSVLLTIGEFIVESHYPTFHTFTHFGEFSITIYV